MFIIKYHEYNEEFCDTPSMSLGEQRRLGDDLCLAHTKTLRE